MKKRLIVMLCLVFILLSSCTSGINLSGASRTANEVRRAGNLKNLCAVPGESAQAVYEMDEAEILRTFYGVSQDDCGEIGLYLAKNAMDVTEIAVFFCETEEQFNSAKLAVSTRLYSQMRKWRDLDFAQYLLLADARYGVSGRYYYLIIAESAAADDAEKRMLEFR